MAFACSERMLLYAAGRSEGHCNVQQPANIKALDSTLESAALTLQAQVVKANERDKKPDARP